MKIPSEIDSEFYFNRTPHIEEWIVHKVTGLTTYEKAPIGILRRNAKRLWELYTRRTDIVAKNKKHAFEMMRMVTELPYGTRRDAAFEAMRTMLRINA